MDTKNFIVILNYNTSNDVIKLINHLVSFNDLIEKIIIVDNNSEKNDQKKILLETSKMKKIDVLILKDNKGYSAGNNKGIYYVKEKYKINAADNLIIMNPDIYITKENFEKTVTNFNAVKYEKKVSMCSPVMFNPNEKNSIIGWKIPNVSTDVISLYFKGVKNKFYKDILKTKNREFFIDCIPGSLLIIDYKSFEEIGYFDESTFLFCEEDIIGIKFKKLKYKTYIDKETKYEHRHSVSINSHYNIRNKFKILLNSKKIYYHNYYNKNNYIKYCFLRLNYMIFVELLLIKKKMKRVFK